MLLVGFDDPLHETVADDVGAAQPHEPHALDVAEALAELVERAYIVKQPDSSFPGSNEYVFTNPREREALERRMRPSAARRYHGAIADWLAWYDSLEPLIMTTEEEAELADWRRKVKEYTIARMQEGFEDHGE